MKTKNIIILGVGNVLFSDEGFGIRVIEALQNRYDFKDNVSVIDGGVLGINLMGVMSQADRLIVVDVIRNNGNPGDVYKINDKEIPERIRAKNSLHQIDFLEALTLCQALDKVPKTTIIGVEPEDIETLKPKLTSTILGKVEIVMEMVLKELDLMNIKYKKKNNYHKVTAYWKG